MTTSRSKHCPACDAKLVEYKHTLCVSFIRAFYKVVKKVAPANRFAFGDFPELSVSEYNNLHKLQYWGLIRKPRDDNATKCGDWIITEKGLDFLSGEIGLQPKVWTFRSVVQRFEGDRVFVDEVTGGWKYRPDYAAEAVPHVPFELCSD